MNLDVLSVPEMLSNYLFSVQMLQSNDDTEGFHTFNPKGYDRPLQVTTNDTFLGKALVVISKPRQRNEVVNIFPVAQIKSMWISEP